MFPHWTPEDRQWFDAEWLGSFPLVSQWDACAEILAIRAKYPRPGDADNPRIVEIGRAHV